MSQVLFAAPEERGSPRLTFHEPRDPLPATPQLTLPARLHGSRGRFAHPQQCIEDRAKHSLDLPLSQHIRAQVGFEHKRRENPSESPSCRSRRAAKKSSQRSLHAIPNLLVNPAKPLFYLGIPRKIQLHFEADERPLLVLRQVDVEAPECIDLFLARCSAVQYLPKFSQVTGCFLLIQRQEQLFFALEMSVECPFAEARGFGNLLRP